VTPVLDLNEALEFQKNLNKTIYLNTKIRNKDFSEKLIQIEKFLFANLNQKVIIDMNAKVLIDNNKLIPKF
jgi:hypothetical protein